MGIHFGFFRRDKKQKPFFQPQTSAELKIF